MAQAKDYTFKITAKCLDNESLSASYVFKLTRNQSDDVITGIEISGNETTKKTIEYKENTGKLYLNDKDGFVSATVKGNGNFKSQVQWKNITDDDYKAALFIDEQPSENSDVIEPYIKLDYPTIQNNAQYIFKL